MTKDFSILEQTIFLTFPFDVSKLNRLNLVFRLFVGLCVMIVTALAATAATTAIAAAAALVLFLAHNGANHNANYDSDACYNQQNLK